jgi:hypothetical protein
VITSSRLTDLSDSGTLKTETHVTVREAERLDRAVPGDDRRIHTRTGPPTPDGQPITAMRTGADDRGVSTYHSAAVLVPDALGVPDSVEVGR